MGSLWSLERYPHTMEVDHRSPPTFDPMLGFPNGRKERELPLTHEQMVEANIPLDFRDYCADKYLEIMRCYRDKSAFQRLVMGACDHASHEFHECGFQDVVLRYKEYERERRLLERQKRRIEKGLEPGPLPTDTQAM